MSSPAKPTAAAQASNKAPSAKPAVADATAKPKKEPKRKPHALIGNKDPNLYPFKEVPPDYNTAQHSPLKKKDFAADHIFLSHRADLAEAHAIALRKQAEEAKALGGKAKAAEAKRLKKMTEKIEELKAKLAASGVDVAALLSATAD